MDFSKGRSPPTSLSSLSISPRLESLACSLVFSLFNLQRRGHNQGSLEGSWVKWFLMKTT
ncbi:hypothetical protein MtrunA17_Chr8g0335391 [Medicago truncatula]|uniref:Uncharacterized protein n=1 Tax=Medicago truncatula TaxID=3880 RepID=A0A072TL02_MEDTR|nr:hypothetical protein MTR_8g006925 [Medicago truncatula]RHN38640.1 hypothetical protein MtrunA17_Chr8g0335391 [Medicago truncatula]